MANAYKAKPPPRHGNERSALCAKPPFARKVVLLAIPLVMYLYFAAYHFENCANLLSPINALLAAGVLLMAYFHGKQKGHTQLLYVYNAIACIAWGVADIGWAYLASKGIDPSDNQILWLFYSLTNLFLFIGFITMELSHPQKWNKAQLITDTLSIGFLSTLLLWTVFFRGDVEILFDFFALDFTSLFSATLDILMAIGILQWVISIRHGHMPQHITVIMAGSACFIAIDLLYYYMAMYGYYIPNGLVDALYSVTFFILALGGLLWADHNDLQDEEINYNNIGFRQRWAALLLIPAVGIILKLTGIVEVPIQAEMILMVAFVIFQNWFVSRYIQLSLENARLWNIAQTQNAMLENRVMRQTQMLTFLSNQDALTGLYNRAYLLAQMDNPCSETVVGQTMCLMIVDIDRLKSINEAYGTDVGDFVIMEYARRLQRWNKFNAVVARYGGEEFGIFTCCYLNREQLVEQCQEIMTRLRQPIQINQSLLEITISIGVVITPALANQGKTLLSNAELALSQAKELGYNRYSIYNPIESAHITSLSRVEMLLRQSVMDTDFQLLYQPQFSLPDRQLIGAEALLRWNPQGQGYIPSSVFIPLAEAIGYIDRIGAWVLQQVLLQSKTWNTGRTKPFKIGLNISPMQLQEQNFLASVLEQLETVEVDPNWIDVEITESVMLKKDAETKATLHHLRDLGLSLSIDDFGSGHASYSYLSEYPFTKIKIDKSLIDHITSLHVSGTQIVKSIIDMANSLHMQTIAEGVETTEQLEVLSYLGCNQIQGFLSGRPVAPSEFERLFIGPASIQ